jgi:hypothetical protein
MPLFYQRREAADLCNKAFLKSKGYIKSVTNQGTAKTSHIQYTRKTKAGDIDVLDYHPGGGIHKSDYWKVYRNNEVQGRIGHGGFSNYERIVDSPVYIDGILANLPK